MPISIKIIVQLLAVILSIIGLFLSAWIVVPAPNMLLLRLGVGAPEVSNWLIVLNLVASLFSVLGMRRSPIKKWAIGASLLALFLSVLPLAQLPATNQRLATAMDEALGVDYAANIPKAMQVKMRSQPFILNDAFANIPIDWTRYTPDILFATPDGVPLKMDVYRPIQFGKYPALVVIYGGAWRSGDRTANSNFSRYMAARGYTVFAIDHRHSPRYNFPAHLNDVRAALAFIQQHAEEYEADLERMALMGRSAGGHLAMLAAYQPDAPPIRAVVSYYAPVDLAGGYADPPNPDPIDTRSVLRQFLGDSPDKLADLYHLASPINYVRPQLPATLFIHGSRDSIVQLKFIRRMYQRLRDAGNTTILLEIPWAEHAFDAIFQGPSNQLAIYYTERFLAWALR